MPEDVIITTGPLGGLGDLLIYSSLPERFSKLGHKVYLDKDNTARNDDIMDLIWGANPYIEGVTDRKPNAGYVNQGHYYDTANRYPLGSIEAMERAHGLPPPYSLAPKIYYQPKPFHQDLSNVVLVDFNAVSSQMMPAGIDAAVQKMVDRFPGANFCRLTFPDGVIRQHAPLSDGMAIRVESLFQYVDILASCRAWVGSEAGGQALAAAVRGEHDVYDLDARPELVCVSSVQTYNSRGYTFRGVDYRITIHSTNSGTDYWSPTEVPYHRYQALCRRTVEEARAIYRARKELEDKPA